MNRQKEILLKTPVFIDRSSDSINDDVLIAPKVSLLSEGHSISPVERPSLVPGHIHLKKGAWIGAGATILPGATVGRNAVVAAGAVVSKAINSTTAWTATTPMSFFSFPMHANLEMISPRPIMLVAGENAHSRYYSEDVYRKASEPKELVIVPDADHVDLYDKTDLIPFDKLEAFFKANLK